MPTVHTLVIGAGQAGLAVSRCLTDGDVDHVVLERGRTAERWRQRQAWTSLRLLTPNWASRLPGWAYRGADPDGFMTATDFADHLDGYAASFDAPVRPDSPVDSVARTDAGFRVSAGGDRWLARNVVIATGWCDRPRVPALADNLHPAVTQLTPDLYRQPDQIPDGPVLVVGASATGVQIADELARAGRDVTLAVGRHSRLVRRYRGLDMWWWLERTGTFGKTIDDVPDPVGARDEGALQLVGRDDHRDVDLPTLQRLGVSLTGRLVDVRGRWATFADDLAQTTADADARFAALLDRIDEHVLAQGLTREVLPAVRPPGIRPSRPAGPLDVSRLGAVVWATGYVRSYPWLQVPVLDRRGEITQRRGVTPIPGLFVLGQRFQHRRDANFIDGVRHDAARVARHIVRLAASSRLPHPASSRLPHPASSRLPHPASSRLPHPIEVHR